MSEQESITINHYFFNYDQKNITMDCFQDQSADLIGKNNVKLGIQNLDKSGYQNQILSLQMNKESQSEENIQHKRSFQSILHNCPKHIIKIIAKILSQNRKQLEEYLQNVDKLIKNTVYMIINFMFKCAKGIIKNAMSKSMLKLIFQQNSQKSYNKNQNKQLKQIFRKSTQQNNCAAKKILRRMIYSKLLTHKRKYIEQSRFSKKKIMLLYIDHFMRQLELGIINLRMPKNEKNELINWCWKDKIL